MESFPVEIEMSDFPISQCVVLLCGLPGVGKSTLAKSIKEHFPSFLNSIPVKSSLSVEIIEYDKIYDQMKHDSQNPKESFDLGAWKETRRVAFETVERFLQQTLK